MAAIFEAVHAADFGSFRREWEHAGVNAPSLKEPKNGRTVYEEVVAKFNALIRRAICTDVFLPTDSWKWAELLAGFHTKLKAVIAILHFMRQDRRLTRSHRDGLLILSNLESPFLCFALLNACDASRPADPLCARDAVLEKVILNDSVPADSEPKRQWLLVRFILERIADAIDALGRRSFHPVPATAQHLLAMAFITGSSRAFKYCCQVPAIFSAADLYNWDLTLHALQHADLPEFLCPLAAARVRCSLASGLQPSLDLRYVSDDFVKRVQALFGKDTAAALRLEVSVARGLVPHGIFKNNSEISVPEYLAGRRGREKRLTGSGAF